MTLPLIGITTYRTNNAAGNPILALGEHYAQAISQAGGIPLLVPLGLPEAQLTALASRLDGILFSGGGDLDPDLFGMQSHSEVNGVDPDRDRVEIQMVQNAVAEGLPFFGICRGLQVINVALGPIQGDKRPYYFRLEKVSLEPIVNTLKKQGYEVMDTIA